MTIAHCGKFHDRNNIFDVEKLSEFKKFFFYFLKIQKILQLTSNNFLNFNFN